MRAGDFFASRMFKVFCQKESGANLVELNGNAHAIEKFIAVQAYRVRGFESSLASFHSRSLYRDHARRKVVDSWEEGLRIVPMLLREVMALEVAAHAGRALEQRCLLHAEAFSMPQREATARSRQEVSLTSSRPERRRRALARQSQRWWRSPGALPRKQS